MTRRGRRAPARPAGASRSRAQGFPPLEPAAGTARILILGSLPGRESLARSQYYAHPRNAFWPLMGDLLGVSPGLPYAERSALLTSRGVAVWDVLRAARRPGSLDSRIERASETANDLAGLLARHPDLALIAFNGATAAALFRRHCAAVLRDAAAAPACVQLPSTSPAHAALSYADKLTQWRAALAPQLLKSARDAP